MILEKYMPVITTILSVTAIIVPVLLYFSSSPEKSLTYQIVSKSVLIGSHDSVENIEIKVKGEVVDNAAIYLLKIKNSGTEPINVVDFEKPMFIKFSDNIKIFSAAIKNRLPQNISISHKVNGNIISIDPLLMNPDDEFEVEVLSSSQDFPLLDSRIAGIKTVKNVSFLDNSLVLSRINLTLSILLLIFYAKFFYMIVRKGTSAQLKILYAIFGIISMLSAFQLSPDYNTDYLIKHFLLSTSLLFIIVAAGGFLEYFESKYNKLVQSTSNKLAD